MLNEVDFSHPVFAPLDDPRYSDLSKLHVWKHRTVDVGSLNRCRVLARFDNGDVAMGEVAIGEGSLLFLTTGWQRSDSELATWSKFVMMMNALLSHYRSQRGGTAQIVVGETIDLKQLSNHATGELQILNPDGKAIRLAPDTADVFTTTESPGAIPVACKTTTELRGI